MVKFSGLTIFEFINHDKATVLSARTSANFSHFPSQVNFMLERDPKIIFYYQHDVENCTDQVLNFLLLDRHEYICTESFSL